MAEFAGIFIGLAVVIFIVTGIAVAHSESSKKKKKKEPKPEPYYFEWSTNILTKELLQYKYRGSGLHFYEDTINSIEYPHKVTYTVATKMNINNLSMQEAKLIIQYYDMEKENDIPRLQQSTKA